MAAKKWYQSKTLWLAIAQGLSGVLVAILSDNPLLIQVGFIAVLKSILDVWVRLLTSSSIQ